jgi:MFS transporter, PAT family, beta-lactamase induction signal transducer AmpG
MTPSRPDRIAPGYLILGAALYALQGVVVAYFFNFNQLYMEAAGVPVDRIGWVQTVALLPFVFKFLGGLLSDRVDCFGFGHRKPYIVIGLVLESAGLIGLTQVHPGHHLQGFVAMAFLAVTGLALFDTCCDGMVIDVTPPPDRARVQGTLVASRFLATMVCSLLFGIWLGRTGNGPGRGDGVLWACAALGLVPLALALRVREPIRAADREGFSWEALGALIKPRALALLAFGTLYAIVSYGVEINLSPYYHSMQYHEQSIGTFAAARYLGRAVGAVVLPLAWSRLGRRSVLVIGVGWLALSTFGQTLVGGGASAGFWGFAFGAANGWDDALFNVLAMEASDPRLAASTYALFTAVTNLSVLGGGLFGSAVRAFGGRYGPVFLGSSVMALAVIVFVPPLARPARKEQPSDVVAA